jgi:antitoxin VapB
MKLRSGAIASARWLAPALRPRLVATIDQHLGDVVYINSIYHEKWTMSATAKLFMHGRSQAVRLPKEFRFEGSEVRVSKVGDKVILEPMAKQPIDFDKFWAELDALGAREFLPDGIPDDPPLEPDPRVFFDE